jgi:hypothetical protein
MKLDASKMIDSIGIGVFFLESLKSINESDWDYTPFENRSYISIRPLLLDLVDYLELHVFLDGSIRITSHEEIDLELEKKSPDANRLVVQFEKMIKEYTDHYKSIFSLDADATAIRYLSETFFCIFQKMVQTSACIELIKQMLDPEYEPLIL